ncbi:basal body-orientation factor 1 [Lingula anatina]|uniref:Basal body-orientation factor 1 n=1 Tax=Lingula anatina TaxID=7574 RepID=A0A1S3HS99_LINAN|nr:basal body-orientation factor 1 [Lingula anatina]|eukprot:XP_013388908.1 basal body-orientation factor 1 [Lingula anatina]
MPKKAKKGGKGKGKGKKGKKGKKSKKAESKVAIATASAKVWETKLNVLEASRQEYRENARRLAEQNQDLQSAMHQTEKDTIEVISFLKTKDQEKDEGIEKLQRQIKDLKTEHRKEKETIIDDCNEQIKDLEDKLEKKNKDIEVLQKELKMVKEFRKKRAQMQRELDEIKDAMFVANKEHKTTLTRMEQKFFEEKMRLQQEANQKIAELAEKAHLEAIVNLDETTRSIYKENVRLSEALGFHVKESDELRSRKKKLEEENEHLTGEKELHEALVQEKVIKSKQQKQALKEQQEKIQTLEQSLSHVVREFERDRQALIEKFQIENESSKNEIVKLQRTVELKTKEMNKVKRLARNILDQRTQIERFFLEALENVKSEIAANQLQYKKDAHAAYQQRMLAAHAGRGEYPKIRTFHKSENSTNSVFQDLEAAQRLLDLSGQVDISDLTWEQKEKVLRTLFAKMNGTKKEAAATPTRSRTAFPAIQTGHGMLSITQQSVEEDYDADHTFLTQADVGGKDGQDGVLGIPDVRTAFQEDSRAVETVT